MSSPSAAESPTNWHAQFPSETAEGVRERSAARRVSRDGAVEVRRLRVADARPSLARASAPPAPRATHHPLIAEQASEGNSACSPSSLEPRRSAREGRPPRAAIAPRLCVPDVDPARRTRLGHHAVRLSCDEGGQRRKLAIRSPEVGRRLPNEKDGDGAAGTARAAPPYQAWSESWTPQPPPPRLRAMAEAREGTKDSGQGSAAARRVVPAPSEASTVGSLFDLRLYFGKTRTPATSGARSTSRPGGTGKIMKRPETRFLLGRGSRRVLRPHRRNGFPIARRLRTSQGHENDSLPFWPTALARATARVSVIRDLLSRGGQAEEGLRSARRRAHWHA